MDKNKIERIFSNLETSERQKAYEWLLSVAKGIGLDATIILATYIASHITTNTESAANILKDAAYLDFARRFAWAEIKGFFIGLNLLSIQNGMPRGFRCKELPQNGSAILQHRIINYLGERFTETTTVDQIVDATGQQTYDNDNTKYERSLIQRAIDSLVDQKFIKIGENFVYLEIRGLSHLVRFGGVNIVEINRWFIFTKGEE